MMLKRFIVRSTTLLIVTLFVAGFAFGVLGLVITFRAFLATMGTSVLAGGDLVAGLLALLVSVILLSVDAMIISTCLQDVDELRREGEQWDDSENR